MSGIVGHTTYAILTLQQILRRKLPTAPLAVRHYSSFLAGAYLGSDIQTMPGVICRATGEEAGYGGLPYADCPGGKSRPWLLESGGEKYAPSRIHELFYGRALLLLGWTKADQALRVPWKSLPEYFAACLEDAAAFYGPSERTQAYLLGWIVHVVSDSLIKSVQPGLTLHLLDGTYTPRNRPAQDLYAFYEIGIKELRLDWPATFADIAATPVEPAQMHPMRIGEPRGQLAKLFPHGWQPGHKALLLAVLAENRRWARRHFIDEIEGLRLARNDSGKLDVTAAVRSKTGLGLVELMDACRAAGLREQIAKIAQESAAVIEAVERLLPRSRSLSSVPF